MLWFHFLVLFFKLGGAPYPFRNISRTIVFRLRCVADSRSRDGTELQIIKSVHRNGAWVLPNKAKYVVQSQIRIFVGRNTHATAANNRLPRSLLKEGNWFRSALRAPSQFSIRRSPSPLNIMSEGRGRLALQPTFVTVVCFISMQRPFPWP